MTSIAFAVIAVLGLWLHTRTVNKLAQGFDARAEQAAQRHAMDLRKILDAAATERVEWRTAAFDTVTAAQAAHDRHIAALLDTQATERDRWLEERTLLLNRIQPETAQPVIHAGEMLAPPAIPFDDDQAFFEDKEALADRLAQTEHELSRMAAR